MKAVQVLTVQGNPYRMREDERFVIGDEMIMRAASKRIHATLEKYIKVVKRDCTMYEERFFYFDVDAYKKDLEVFGVEIPGFAP